MGRIIPSKDLNSTADTVPRSTVFGQIVIPRVEVIRSGRLEPLLAIRPTLSSASVQWHGIAVENYFVPAGISPCHEHPWHFLQVVVRGVAKYEVKTGGRNLQFKSRRGTALLEPRGTVDEITWKGASQRVVAAIHPHLLIKVLEETAHQADIELTQNWNLIDHHIETLLLEMSADLIEGSPAGRIYGESLANALAVYLLKRYTVRHETPVVYKGGLPGYRLKRVLDYIEANLAENPSLSQLAAVAGMSPHYFSELFRVSTGCAPHKYVLIQRIEHSKQQLRNSACSIVEAGVSAGFQNASHFARMFHRLVGTTPSMFRSKFEARDFNGPAGAS